MPSWLKRLLVIVVGGFVLAGVVTLLTGIAEIGTLAWLGLAGWAVFVWVPDGTS